jgi:hypothetical protein
MLLILVGKDNDENSVCPYLNQDLFRKSNGRIAPTTIEQDMD